MKCPVMSYEMSMVWGDFGQPVSWSSGLCSFVAGEFACYVFPWNFQKILKLNFKNRKKVNDKLNVKSIS